MNSRPQLTLCDRPVLNDANEGKSGDANGARVRRAGAARENVWTRRIRPQTAFACYESATITEFADGAVKLAMELIDLDTLRQLEEDTSKELLPQMIALFCKETRERIAKIHQATQTNDFVALASEAHAIKSGAGTFGARELQALARIVEQASRDGEYEVAAGKAAELEQVASLSLEMLTQCAASTKDAK